MMPVLYFSNSKCIVAIVTCTSILFADNSVAHKRGKRDTSNHVVWLSNEVDSSERWQSDFE